jgi:hypothetical protein
MTRPTKSIRFAPRLAAATISALSALVVSDAHAEERPTPGSWRKLAVRRFELPEEARLERIVEELPTLVRAYRPQGAKISDVSFSDGSVDKAPEIRFRATVHVDVSVGPLHVSRDETVNVAAQVRVQKTRCSYDPGREAYEIYMDLTRSDEPLAANAQALAVALCVGATEKGQRAVELTSFMQIGPDYGTRAAGRIATDLLARQADALVTAIRATAK